MDKQWLYSMQISSALPKNKSFSGLHVNQLSTETEYSVARWHSKPSRPDPNHTVRVLVNQPPTETVN